MATKVKLTAKHLEDAGFEPVRNSDGIAAWAIGPVHARLTVVCGYEDSGWWAMVVKHPSKGSLYSDAGRCAHFPKRLYSMTNVRRLAASLGIELKPTGSQS